MGMSEEETAAQVSRWRRARTRVAVQVWLVRVWFWGRCPYPYAAWVPVRQLVTVIVVAGMLMASLPKVDVAQDVWTGLLAVTCVLVAAKAVYQRYEGHRIVMVRGAGPARGMCRASCKAQSLTMSEPVAFASCTRCGVLDVEHLETPKEPAAS
jgi:hypothetical protein